MVESRPPCRGDEIGKHSGLKNKLSAQPETAGAEPLKFGEPPGPAGTEATPSQAGWRVMRRRGRCRD
ncbi:hypothetical protein PSP6_610018 [Paraburkholderia tropica]|nr:hypothetical protein PSP6_610018 [Paraburkholderia tropica]